MTPIPQFGGALPWRAGVALLCLLPLAGCQVVAYQHNDYRRADGRLSDNRCENSPLDRHGGVLGRDGGEIFPGLFGISPGIEDLVRTAGPGCWVAHSAGAARAVSLIRPDRCPRVLLLIDPWPPNIEAPAGPEVVYVVTGRPGRITVAPGTRLVELSHAGGACPWAWTVGHVYACRWSESREAASMAAAQARMASAGSSSQHQWTP